MQPNDASEAPSAGQEGFTLSNKVEPYIPLYWIKWNESDSYYYQGDSMKEYLRIRTNLLDFPKLTKHFSYSHKLTF